MCAELLTTIVIIRTVFVLITYALHFAMYSPFIHRKISIAQPWRDGGMEGGIYACVPVCVLCECLCVCVCVRVGTAMPIFQDISIGLFQKIPIEDL